LVVRPLRTLYGYASEFHWRVYLQPIFEAIFQVAAYYVGSVVVPVVSFDRWKCDRLLRDVPKKKLRWGGLYHRRGQRIYLAAEATALVGLVFSGLVIGLILWWHFRG